MSKRSGETPDRDSEIQLRPERGEKDMAATEMIPFNIK